ncbi:lantibiotic immunity ABC transporter MutE/EpiE family permease subunit [Paenibacillus sp. EKM102P]|uniref:lantibiotic immunity ABC transporter MutE/EpiE family permease subunit n=1 Tax=unclassified Paenibacillus TaxID=185978 RepID=UPI00142DEE89|nr:MULTISPECIES: lantibiotic immunity ABC transporter MutE/EpiE family permease subunit [unclassified Paenibacillus]KAF6616496.1 lantibiotic immunity ABC transporter MutE/EpiE family permease subunit [Paenibacillus sp. EKM101P]KAF6623794.1 lantibiotic immunity ABC transporter MutE/EpiE family permease subunit [Paenibacillus sp. EKM102P]KAF6633642.1 lantibiotic immunity ABC transporter MutE/EpiE family permease subunit [Paenibacillus sp. EKM10P]KAF6649169.1 lantibiotic immunity ABC transporter M
MQQNIAAEHLKLKRTFTKKLVWLAPIVTLLLCTGLMGGHMFQSASYNWWYIMLLPGALTLMCSGVIQKDGKKLKYRAILGMSVDLAQVWYGKIGVCVRLLMVSSIILFVGITLGGFVFSSSVTLAGSVAATLIPFVTFLWQIPLCLFLTDRIGMFATLIINMLGNVACTILFATSSIWWAVPYAIPARLMCAVIQVLPNGLAIPSEDPLLDRGVIVPGLVITVGLFMILSVLTAMSFRKREAK